MRKLVTSKVLVTLLALVAAITAALAVAGSPSAAQGPTTIRVAVTRSADALPIVLGIRNGTFAKAGFRVKIVYVKTGDTAIGFVAEQRYADFGAAGTVNLLLTPGKGTAVKIVAGSTVASGGQSAVIVKADSEIRSASDLAYRTVAVPQLRRFATLATSSWITLAGGDPSQVTYVATQTSAMVDAVRTGTVEAAVVEWPHSATVAKTSGIRVIGDSERGGFGAGATTSAWFTSAQTASGRPAVVKRFAATLRTVVTDAARQKASVRALIASVTRVPAGVVASLTVPGYSPTLSRSTLDDLALDLLSSAYVAEQPDVDGLLHPAALVK